MAGGQIPVRENDMAQVAKLADAVIRRFLNKLGAKRSDLHLLLEGREPVAADIP